MTSAHDGVVEKDSVFVQLLKTAGITLNAGERQNDIGMDLALILGCGCIYLSKERH